MRPSGKSLAEVSCPEALLIYGSAWIDAYEPKTGKTLWAIGEVGVGPVAGRKNYPRFRQSSVRVWALCQPRSPHPDDQNRPILTRERQARGTTAFSFAAAPNRDCFRLMSLDRRATLR